jgi:hypothetical protein
MPQLKYTDADELPKHLQVSTFRDRDDRRWKVAALITHLDLESGKVTKKVAYLRRADSSGGPEWEIPLDTLYETAEVDR